MKLHANAALSLNKRRLLAKRIVEQGWSLGEAAEAAETSERTAGKWARRYRAEGEAGLHDRPSAAHEVHNRTAERRIGVIASLRRLRFAGTEIAELLGMPQTTVSGTRPPASCRPPRSSSSATRRSRGPGATST
jgi:hypothetical protein